MTKPEVHQTIKLSELNRAIKTSITENFSENYWIIAEISEIKVHSSGHCYLELVEKDDKSDRIIAKARATIWAFTFKMLKPYFETTTGYPLETGAKILVSVKVEFHEIYGYSLNISDIDPTYTLGDIAKKRQEIINRLEKEGVINMNRELAFPLVPQKIAIISSSTAAGFQDFTNQLKNNPFGYIFYHKLFPAILQGDQAAKSILRSMDSIYTHEDFFDLVVIIRGGGSKSDLSAFDDYDIAYHITQFPLPVLTGIGHEQDDTIADLVAHTKLKTPTAVAEFIIGRVHNFENQMVMMNNQLVQVAGRILREQQKLLAQLNQRTITSFYGLIRQQYDNIDFLSKKFKTATDQLLKNIVTNLTFYLRQFRLSAGNVLSISRERLNKVQTSFDKIIPAKLQEYKKHLEYLNQRAIDLDPKRILERGFSITMNKGIPVKKSDQVIQGDEIETILSKGKINSIVRKN